MNHAFATFVNKKLAAVLSNIALSIFTVIFSVPALAHHTTAHYDFPKPAEMSGTVKLISVTNPHMKLILMVNDSKGTREIEFEGHSLNHYYRAGWRKGIINEGDKITISYAPRKDGEEGGYVTALKPPSGEWIHVGAAPG